MCFLVWHASYTALSHRTPLPPPFLYPLMGLSFVRSLLPFPRTALKVHDVALAVKGGEIPLGVYVPKTASDTGRAHKGVVVWLHGD